MLAANTAFEALLTAAVAVSKVYSKAGASCEGTYLSSLALLTSMYSLFDTLRKY
jgi:hypothetical protein